MKHGRPERFESGYCNVFGTWRWFRPERGWRREHAARVFQAIQAVVAVSCLEMAHAKPDAGCQTLGHVGECCYWANWLWNNNPYFGTRNP